MLLKTGLSNEIHTLRAAMTTNSAPGLIRNTLDCAISQRGYNREIDRLYGVVPPRKEYKLDRNSKTGYKNQSAVNRISPNTLVKSYRGFRGWIGLSGTLIATTYVSKLSQKFQTIPFSIVKMEKVTTTYAAAEAACC